MGCAQSSEPGPEGPLRGPLSGAGGSAAAGQPVSTAQPVPDATEALGKAGTPARSESPTSVACFKPEGLEDRRLQALLDCKLLDTPEERRFDAITTLVKQLLQVPIVLVGLIDDDRLWFKSAAGTESRQGDRLHSFCDASLRAPNPTMMIVPDTLQDARFQRSQFVVNPPHVRFYSGAPLVSSEGYVLGSLGVMDVVPRSFPAGALNMLCNFAELVVREMERDKAAARAQVQSAVALSRQTVRALSCFSEAVLLVDVAVPSWPVLYVNDQWCKATGLSEPSCLNSGLWQLFTAAGGATAGALAQAQGAIAARKPFLLALTGASCASLQLALRPATADFLSAAAPHVGIPNFVEGTEPAALEGLASLYFGIASNVTLTAAAGSKQAAGGSRDDTAALPSLQSSSLPAHSSPVSSSAGSARSFQTLSSFDLEYPETLKDIQLGPLLGRGSFGRVYRGTWRSASVAVKILTTWVDPESEEPTGPHLEALLSKKLAHPNVVQTFEYALRTVGQGESGVPEDDWWQGERERVDQAEAAASAAAAGKRQQQVWILQQYCDHGTLGDAVDRGWLRSAPSADAPPDMRAVLATAKEVAAALRHCHRHGVLHGDLSAGNVLLAGARHEDAADPRSFSAKVCDFGLAHVLAPGQRAAQTRTCGTLAYMPLELIEDQLLTRACDAYAFGVLCWEMLAGRRAWAGRQPVQILYHRTVLKAGLEVPPGCPPGFKALVEACLSDDPAARPSFDSICDSLDSLLAAEAAGRDPAAGSPPRPARGAWVRGP